MNRSLAIALSFLGIIFLVFPLTSDSFSHYSHGPAPVLYTFITNNWIVGKSFEMSSCYVKYLVELLNYLEDGPLKYELTSTTKVLIEFTKHAQKRIANIKFFEETMEMF